MANQHLWDGKPPAPKNDTERQQNTVDILASADMHSLWIYVERHGLSKPHLEGARKQIRMPSNELTDHIRQFLADASRTVQDSNGARLLKEWYLGQPVQLELVSAEAHQ
ncbi:hypothetical protein [Glycomyces sp. YM15]|uniref:hypothetical protein n=1 Tax=Glycomyces sp. YM15 TaxID=2800446 RepID=UPI001963BF7C|nr:hypothetical protein [Glycomyces sp. YM15]